MANDTTTELDVGSGGDKMDESLVTQADGSTQAKRPRVDLGFQSDDPRGRLVAEELPLPTLDARAVTALEQLVEDMQAIRDLLEQALT